MPETSTTVNSDPTRSRRWRSPALLVTAMAFAYACIITYPLILHLDSAIYGYPGDSTGAIAVYSYWGYALHHGLSIFDNNLWGAPYGAGWQAIPFGVLSVLVLAPLSWLAGGTVAYNFLVLSGFPLTAWVTYLAARRLGSNSLGSTFAALAFTFVPYHLEKAQGHPAQTHMEFLSGILLFVLCWRQGGSRWNLGAAGVLAGLTIWNDLYLAFIASFIFLTLIVVSLCFAEPRTTWRGRLRSHLLAAMIVGVVTLAFVPAAVLLAVRPTSGSLNESVGSQTAAFHQSLGEVNIYSLRPWEFILPYYDNPLVAKSVVSFEARHLHGSNFVEQSLFLGYTVMLLAAVTVFVRWRSFETTALLALGVVGFMVGLPPSAHFTSIDLPMPSQFLHEVFPIFRVYARFGIMVMLGATLLAGLGLTLVQDRLHGRWLWLLAIPFVLAAVEFNNVPPLHVTQIYPAPTEYQWLAKQPPGILVEYPLKSGNSQVQEVETRQYTLYQHVHGHPIFNGATTASYADSLYGQMEPYYARGVAQAMHDIGIRYVFVHRDDYERAGYDLRESAPGLTFIQTINGVDIYTVN